jgi:hypothetical protein
MVRLRGKLWTLAGAAVCAGIFLASPAARGFEPGEFWISASGGWSRLAPLGGRERPAVDGGGGGARVMFALSDAFGLALEGTATWYRGFAPAPAPVPEEEAEDGTAELAAPGPATTGITCRDGGLTLVYAVDVFALVPQVALGLAGLHTAETRGGETRSAWDLALRVDVGADYRMARRFALGLWATFDTMLAGASPWAARTAVALRLAFPLGGGDLGSGDPSR